LVQGDTEGFVRFDTAESAKTALAKADADGKVELVDGDYKRAAGIALITGDEEQTLIDKVQSGCPFVPVCC
jgi:RNA binding motif